jgi:hypothetical protein
MKSLPEEFDIQGHLWAYVREKKQAGKFPALLKVVEQLILYASEKPNAPLYVFPKNLRDMVKGTKLYKIWGLDKNFKISELPRITYKNRELVIYTEKI